MMFQFPTPILFGVTAVLIAIAMAVLMHTYHTGMMPSLRLRVRTESFAADLTAG